MAGITNYTAEDYKQLKATGSVTGKSSPVLSGAGGTSAGIFTPVQGAPASSTVINQNSPISAPGIFTEQPKTALETKNQIITDPNKFSNATTAASGTVDPTRYGFNSQQEAKDWISANQKSSNTTSMTPEQRATYTASNQGITNANGTAVTVGRPEEQAKAQSDYANSQAVSQKNQLDAQLQQQNYQYSQSQRQANAGLDALIAQLGGGNREGATSFSNIASVGQITQDVQNQLQQQQRQLEAYTQQINDTKSQIDTANKLNNTKLAQQLQTQLDQITAAKNESQAAADKANTEKLKAIQDIVKEEDLRQQRQQAPLFESFNKNPALFGAMDPMSLVNSFGVKPEMAQAIVSMGQQAQKLDVNSPDYQLKMAQVKNTLAQAQWAGMTTEQKNFQVWQQMPEGPSKTAFAQATGLDKSPTALQQAQIDKYRADAAKALGDTTGTYVPPQGKLSAVTEHTPDGQIVFNIPTDVNVKTSGILRSDQCGAFVNDFYGTSMMGDSYQSKLRYNNSKEPVVGGAFIMNTGNPIGHCGVITGINSDGSIDIADVNAKGTGQFRTAIIYPDSDGTFKSKGIVGFYDPHPGSETTSGTPIEGATGITGATGLSIQAFNFLTQGTSSMSRMSSAQRNKVMDEANNYLNKSGTDISTFQSQYKALNDVLKSNIERENRTKIMAGEVSGTADNLISAIDEKDLGKLRFSNIVDLALGKQVNDPATMKYSFQLKTLANDYAGYLAASRGDTRPDVADLQEAARVISEGVDKGSVQAFKASIDSNVEKVTQQVEKAAETSKKGVWDLFGVGSKYKTKEQEVPTSKSSDDEIGSYLKANGQKVTPANIQYIRSQL